MGRFRFQYSLLTAVVVMLVAGGMLGVNMHRYNLPNKNLGGNWCIFYGRDSFVTGWPFPAYEFRTYPDWAVEGITSGCFPVPEKVVLQRRQVSGEVVWQWFGLSGDVLVALTILIAAGVLCEWLVRRRDRRATLRA